MSVTRYDEGVARRFTQPDTIVPGGGAAPQGLNRCSYVTNNPATFNDPSGHEQCRYNNSLNPADGQDAGAYICWDENEAVTLGYDNPD